MGNSFNDTSQYRGYYYTYGYNYTGYDYSEHYRKVQFIKHVSTCILITIGLPLTLMAIYSLYSLVRKDNVAPIYVINLLISDLIQLCSLSVREALRYREMTDEEWLIWEIFSYIHFYCVVASVGFMVCIALERYLVIAHPLWYRCRRTIKISVVVCVFVWVVPLVPTLMLYCNVSPIVLSTFLSVPLLLPFPLFIFFLGGILKALSASISVSSEEKRRIVGILVLVLLIYTLLFLPFIIWEMVFINNFFGMHKSLFNLSYMLLKVSPLADLVLYIFMRKGAIDKLLASLCCCRMDSNDVSSPDSNDVTRPIV